MKITTVKGFSTLELLIAFAILTLSLTAMVSVVFGNQSVAVDTETASDALAAASDQIEDARAKAASDYFGVTSTGPTSYFIGPLEYTKELLVTDLTPCKKQATSTITWSLGPLRTQKVELTTYLTDIAGALAIGGDCFASPPTGGWTNPTRFASDTLSPGKPTSMDVLDGIAYLGLDKSPWLAIADTRSATLGQNSGLFVTFPAMPLLSAAINSIDAVRWTSPGGAKKVYLFAAMNSVTNQFIVIDATDITAPAVVAVLSPCATGSFPQGWYVYALGNQLYFTTRETANKELHIYDITTPSAPAELPIGTAGCYGYELGSTVEQFVVRDQRVAGVDKRFMFMATDQNAKEIRVLDVTSSSAITEATSVDIAGNQDGASIYLVGNKMYFGRRTNSGGPEFYVYNASNPAGGLSLLGSREINTDVLGIRVAGKFAFLGTGKTNQEFQVWNISNPSAITNIATYNFGNIVGQGVDYEPDFIYATGQATPNFQMLYSP